MLYDLAGMATALAFEGGSSEPAVVDYKYIYDNGIYNAADDGLDGYSELDVWVDSEPYIRSITAKANGLYTSAEYDCDAFDTVTVSVGEDFDFCDKPDIDEITPVVDEEYFVYDKDTNFGLSVELENNNTRLVVYKVFASGWKQNVYGVSSSLHYDPASYITVSDPSAGTFVVHYAFTDYQPGTWRTYSRTISSVIGYGASGHRFTAVKK